MYLYVCMHVFSLKIFCFLCTYHDLGFQSKSFSFYLQLILNEMAENCLEISTDKVGYHVIQCCVSYGDHEETRERLLNGIIAYAPLLSEHPYGFVDPDLHVFLYVFFLNNKSYIAYFLYSILVHARITYNQYLSKLHHLF